MPNIAILYCKKIKDHSCVGCAKCFKGIKEKEKFGCEMVLGTHAY